MPLRKGFLIGLLVLLLASADAQTPQIRFTRFSTIKGLPHNTITGIVQDGQGYIQIGTHNGISRFDGRSFQNTVQENSPGALPNNIVRQVKALTSKRLAFLTDGGAHILNTKTGRGTNLILEDTTAFYYFRNRVWDLLAFPDGSFLISTNTGFFYFSEWGKVLSRFDEYGVADLGKNMRWGRELLPVSPTQVACFYEEKHKAKIFDRQSKSFSAFPHAGFGDFSRLTGSSWTSILSWNNRDYFLVGNGSDSLYHYDVVNAGVTASCSHLSGFNELSWPSKLIPIRDSALVLTSPNGGFFLVNFNPKTKHLTVDTLRYLKGIICNAALCDRSGRLWIGTDHGLFMQNFIAPLVAKLDISPLVANWHKAPDISNFVVDSNTLYCCCGHKDGVTQVDAKTGSLQKHIRFGAHLQPEWNDVFSIAQLGKDTLLLGSMVGLGCYSRKTRRLDTLLWLHQPMIAQQQDAGGVWFCSYKGSCSILYFNRATGKITDFTDSAFCKTCPVKMVRHLALDERGNLWAGGSGLACYNSRRKCWGPPVVLFPAEAKRGQQVSCLQNDGQGHLWLGMTMNGLIKYTIASGEVAHYGVAEGLSSGWVNHISKPHNGKLFIQTNIQIDVLDLKSNEVIGINHEDGLPEDGTNGSIVIDTATNKIWMSAQGFLVSLPADNSTAVVPAPHLIIESLGVSGDTVFRFPTGRVQLRHNQNNISLVLSTLNFDNAEADLIYFKLQDKEPWTSIGSDRKIFLPNLRSGTYPLRIKLNSQSGRWPNQVVTLSIVIEPPFWQRWWFYGLVAFALSGITYVLVKQREKAKTRSSALDQQLANYKLLALHSQMNPHFVFNCLNSIKELILNGNNASAAQYLNHFAALIRSTLEESRQNFVTLGDTVAYIERYIKMEQLRFEDFESSVGVAAGLERSDILIPPLLIQPLVENAIWHGLCQIESVKKLVVTFSIENERLCCRITDNGPGINESLKQNPNPKHHATGIANIRTRLELLNAKYNLGASLTITDLSEINQSRGTLALLKMKVISE